MFPLTEVPVRLVAEPQLVGELRSALVE